MKKLILNLKNAGEILSRKELKHIIGGNGSMGSIADCYCNSTQKVCSDATKGCAVKGQYPNQQYSCDGGPWTNCPDPN